MNMEIRFQYPSKRLDSFSLKDTSSANLTTAKSLGFILEYSRNILKS